jgi:hypothetical protein
VKLSHATATPKGPPGREASSVAPVILDLETRSAIDLRQVPAGVYASHPSTSLLCLAWQFIGEAEVYSWTPGDNDTTDLDRLHQAITDGAEVHA